MAALVDRDVHDVDSSSAALLDVSANDFEADTDSENSDDADVGTSTTPPAPAASRSAHGSTSSSSSTTTSTPSENTNVHGKKIQLLDRAECIQIVNEHFPDQNCHSFHLCREMKCCGLLRDGGTGGKSANVKDKFLHSWVQDPKFWWVVYVEGKGTYCLICMKHKVKSSLKKASNPFVDQPSCRFKKSALTGHLDTALHDKAIEAEALQRVSFFHKEYTEQVESCNSVLREVFALAYFLMKEHVPNRKIKGLLELLQEHLGADELRHFKHRSEGSLRSIFLTIGETIKEILLEIARNSGSYGLLIDEATDIAVLSQLVTFISFVNSSSGELVTKFLSISNLLENFESCNAEAITETVISEMNVCKLEIKKLTGLATDGASVMLGKHNGVAARLKQVCPTLINIHCICHQLALACTESNSGLAYIKTVETTLRQLWQWLENSPKRMASFLKVQLELKKAKLLDAHTEKVVLLRLKKACSTRWLSFDNSVHSVKREYLAVLQNLNVFAEKDPAAYGLLQRMKNAKFLGAIYILDEILPILSELSRVFQADAVNFSAILPAVEKTKQKLVDLKSDDASKALDALQLYLDSLPDVFDDKAAITLKPAIADQLVSLNTKYIDSLVQNIDKRFQSVQKSGILSAFSIFDPLAVPPKDGPGFKDYGAENVKTLAKHFCSDSEEKLAAEFQQMKYHIVDKLLHEMPADVKEGKAGCDSPTLWFLKLLMRQRGSLQPFFSNLLQIAEVALTLPVSNAWPERGASAMKLVKTRGRSVLKNDMLEALMMALINGPPIKEAHEMLEKAVSKWLQIPKTSRRKLPPSSSVSTLRHQLSLSTPTGTDDGLTGLLHDEPEPPHGLSAELHVQVEDDDTDTLNDISEFLDFGLGHERDDLILDDDDELLDETEY